MNHIIRRNNIKIFGDCEQVMFFVHGYGCDQSMWRYVTPTFEPHYKIVLIDLVGSGKSEKENYDYDRYSDLRSYAEDIIEICDLLNFKDIVYVGHSVSAMIGALIDVEKPDLIKDLILIGPSPCYVNDENYHGGFTKADIDQMLETLDSNYLGWSSTMAPVIMGNPERPELAGELENSFCQNDPKIAKHFARVTFTGDNRSDLKNVEVKSLIIQSNQDAIAGIDVGKYVHENIKNSEFVIIDAIGHCPHLSAPKATAFAIKNYLN